MADLLLEIGVEEVPALLVRPTLDQLRERAAELLSRARLEATNLRSFGTPRRLALTVELPARQQTRILDVTGPPATAAYDATGKPTAAAIGFAKSQGVAVESLRLVQTEKGKYLAARKEEKALPTPNVLQQVLPELLGRLEFPKTMRWNVGGGQRFIRPIQWIAALLDRRAIIFSFAGVKSGARSYGHRELAPKAVALRRSADYAAQLRRVFVLVDDAERRAEIDRQVKAHASALRVISDDNESVISQAVYSCEWPIVAVGAFDQAYLELPRALRLAVLRQQQGYLPLVRPNHGMVPKFLCILDGVEKSTLRTRQKNLVAVVHDHERVLRARLEDAQFYAKRDLVLKLADRVPSLKQVTFHEKLGTLYDKTQRVKRLAVDLAQQCHVDQQEAERAAELCKADLVTGLVREFPELQGAVGGEYAQQQGESDVVAQAIAEHYQPRSAEENVPDSQLGQVLSLADKVDTLIGYFGIGLAPTGSEDPYGLRRQAAGVVKLLAKNPAIDLTALLKKASEQFARDFQPAKRPWPNGVVADARKFLAQRLEWQLLADGRRPDLVAAVVAAEWKNPAEAARWLLALERLLPSSAGEDLLVVYRRVGRIVPPGFSGSIQPANLTETEERRLHAAWETAREETARAADEAAALIALARLRPAVDAFFDKVMVMVEDAAVQANRLALVNAVKKLFEPIADFSKISTAPAAAHEAARAGGGREA
ncbi:MAG: glycine--tRNA ligase subunit beta [Nitrospirota bacterium]